MVAGTQSERGKTNHVIVMKMSNLYRTGKPDKEKGSADDDNEDESSSESEDEDEKPDLETAVLTHSSGCVNRIRVTFAYPEIFFRGGPTLTIFFSSLESKIVNIF